MLKRSEPVPLYYQLELHLRGEIDRGLLVPGDRIPPEVDLSRQFGVSRVTVREALRRMEEDGLISRNPRKGTVVLPHAAEGRRIERNPSRLLAFEEDLLRHGLQPRVEVLSFESWPASEGVAALLQTEPGHEVIRARRLGWAGDKPLWLESRYFNSSIGESVAREAISRAGVAAYLSSVVGIKIVKSLSRVSATAASVNQAKALDINPGDPLLTNEFAFYSTSGHVEEAGRAAIRADRYTFVFETPADLSGNSSPNLVTSGVVSQQVR